MQSTSTYIFLVLRSYLLHKNTDFSEGIEEIIAQMKIFLCIFLFQSGPVVNPGILDPTNPTLLELRCEFSIHALLKTILST